MDNFTDIKRTINIQKADCLIAEKLSGYYSTCHSFKACDSDIVYLCRRYDLNRFSRDTNNNPNISSDELFKDGKVPHNYKYDETEYIILSKSQKKDTDLMAEANMILSTKAFNLSVDSTIKEMTVDDYKSIRDMLESSDNATIALGLDMLTNYNYKKSEVKIAALLAFNYLNIRKNNKFKSVGIKNILELLPPYICNESFESVLNRFDNMIKDHEEELEFSRDVAKYYLQKKFKNKYDLIVSRYISNIKLDCELKIE